MHGNLSMYIAPALVHWEKFCLSFPRKEGWFLQESIVTTKIICKISTFGCWGKHFYFIPKKERLSLASINGHKRINWGMWGWSLSKVFHQLLLLYVSGVSLLQCSCRVCFQRILSFCMFTFFCIKFNPFFPFIFYISVVVGEK